MVKRISPNDTVKKHLLDEVNGLCPLCGVSLLPQKGQKPTRAFEITHIYPLNPTDQQKTILKGLTPPGGDINGLGNLLAACERCHPSYDKNFTKEEYDTWVALKQRLSKKRDIKQLFSVYALESDIKKVIDDLSSSFQPGEIVRTDYNLLKINEKLDSTMPFILKKNIENNVIDYFLIVQNFFIEINKITPYKFETISAQIKAFCLKCLQEQISQTDIYNHLVSWLVNKTSQHDNAKACEIIIFFFIQNCEVFSATAK